jgi:hypothetical protein
MASWATTVVATAGGTPCFLACLLWQLLLPSPLEAISSHSIALCGITFFLLLPAHLLHLAPVILCIPLIPFAALGRSCLP